MILTHEPCRTRGDCYHASGGRRTQATWGKTSEAHEAEARGGRIGGHNQSREAKSRAGRIGGLIGGPIGGRKLAERRKADPELDYQLRNVSAYAGRIGARNQPREAKVRAGHIGGRKSAENGQLAQNSKGVPSTADGILFRSQTEASFYCVAEELGGEPTYEPAIILLPDGRSYTPDFILDRSILGIPENVPIELKPARNAFNLKNLPKAIEAGAFVIFWDELVEAP